VALTNRARCAVDADWIMQLPKAEVHVHLEGCVPLSAVGLEEPHALAEAGFELDRSTGAPLFTGLADFLAFLDLSCGLVTDGSQVEKIAREIAARAAANGVGHTDVIFNPTHWPAWRRRLEEFVARLDAGFAAGEADYGVTAALCLSLKRTQPPAESAQLVEWLLGHRPERIVALSVDGNEAAAGRTGERFAPLFARARSAGLHRCAHAGESSGPEGVRDALDLLCVERIDHGVRAIEDPSLVEELAMRGVPLDMCPTSNVRLGVVTSIADHPIEPLRAAGVGVSVNTDDPLIFGTSVASEYLLCSTAFEWDRTTVARIALTSIRSCFAAPERKQELLASWERYTSE
jgi:adenosine deaminase